MRRRSKGINEDTNKVEETSKGAEESSGQEDELQMEELEERAAPSIMPLTGGIVPEAEPPLEGEAPSLEAEPVPEGGPPPLPNLTGGEALAPEGDDVFIPAEGGAPASSQP